MFLNTLEEEEARFVECRLCHKRKAADTKSVLCFDPSAGKGNRAYVWKEPGKDACKQWFDKSTVGKLERIVLYVLRRLRSEDGRVDRDYYFGGGVMKCGRKSGNALVFE